jgi:hypothetical protein
MSFFRLTLSFITGVYVGQTYPTVFSILKAFPSLKDDVKKNLDKIGEK